MAEQMFECICAQIALADMFVAVAVAVEFNF